MQDKFQGCFLGLAYGDAMCASYEGGPIERLLWFLIGKTKAGALRYTDDTQMSLDIAHSFLRDGGIKQDQLAREFANSYRWSRGYGPSAGKILKKIRHGVPWREANVSVYKNGSFGNGAAMRAPILAMCFMSSSLEFKQSIIQSSEITHANPLAIEGALLVAYSVAYALSDMSQKQCCAALMEVATTTTFQEKLALCNSHLHSDTPLNCRQVKTLFGNGITAEHSCVTAIYLALLFRHKSFINLLNFIKKLGGDTDTIAAMSGAIWGAFNGAEKLQSEALPKIEKPEQIIKLADQLYSVYALNEQAHRSLNRP